MDHNEIVSALEDLVPEINRTKDPHGVLIKYAGDRNLSPAQLEKMGQTFNVARTLSFMEKSANRGGTFPLLDIPKLVADYTKVDEPDTSVKSASTAAAVVHAERFPIDFLRDVRGWQAPAEAPAQVVKEASAEPEYSEIDIQNLDQIAFESGEKYREKIAHVVNLVVFGSLDFEDFEKSARALYPEIDNCVFDTIAAKLSEYKGLTVKRASAMQGLAADITGRAGLAKDAFDALDMARGARALHKSASAALDERKAEARSILGDPDQEKPKKPGDPDQAQAPKPKREKGSGAGLITVKDPDEAPARPAAGGGKGLLDTAVDSAAGAGEAIGMIGKAKGKNTGQMHIDKVLSNTHAAANIQRLLISDPVISKADPETVVSLAASLGAQNPSTLSDINILRTVLREALQYEGVPLHTYKDLLGMRESELKGDKLTRENEEATYGGSSGKDK